MYPGTIVNWFDESQLTSTNAITNTINTAPLFMVVSSADKGPEDLMEVSDTDFQKLFGTMKFAKHGQNGIQAQNIINNGGRLLFKRVVADDSTLANIVLCANIAKSTEGTTDTTTVKWTTSTIENAKSFKDVVTKAKALQTESLFPLFIIADNGRGTSVKSVKISPDYTSAKTTSHMMYTLKVYEGNAVTETETFSLDPNFIYNKTSFALTEDSCEQITAIVDEAVYDKYVAALKTNLEISADELAVEDIVFGKTYKGGELGKKDTSKSTKMVLAVASSSDATPIDISESYGIALTSGSNGAFGDTPAINSTNNAEAYAAWAKAIRNVYLGIATDSKGRPLDEVWDVDSHKISAVFDANFPVEVKAAISYFVMHREDCMFFADLGTGINTYAEIKEAYDKCTAKQKLVLSSSEDDFVEVVPKSRYIAYYFTTYDIQDPNTLKIINVTMMYDLAGLMVSHIADNANKPVAGIVNSFVLPSPIKGTLNYVPIVTPTVNQKEAIEELHINYAIYNEDDCVVQSEYTSQDEDTELSYINNVLAIEEVVRAIRIACPKNRYALITGYDLSDYSTAVSEVLEYFSSNFSMLKFAYTANDVESMNKIYHASLQFKFNEWAQTEYFDIYALPTTSEDFEAI